MQRTIPMILASMSLLNFSSSAETPRPILFEIHITLTDPENRPLPSVAGRFVLGAGAEWQSSTQGIRFQTDSYGKAVLQANATLREGSRKRPANFLDSLLSSKETIDDLQIAVELTYAGEPFLYVAEGHRFRGDRTVLLGQTSVFSRDPQGYFTRVVPRSKEGGWLLPQFPGLAVTTPGNEIAGFLFYPAEKDPSDKTWILRCQFKQAAAPVLR